MGQNAHVHDHGFRLATHSLATCSIIIVIIIIINIINIINSKSYTLNPKLLEHSLEYKV